MKEQWVRESVLSSWEARMCCLYVFELTGCSVVLYGPLVSKKAMCPAQKTCVVTAHSVLVVSPVVVL